MKKRFLSILCSMTLLCAISMISVFEVKAEESEQKVVDGSVLTMDDSSTSTLR